MGRLQHCILVIESVTLTLILDAAEHTKTNTILPGLEQHLMWIIKQENQWANIYYKLFYVANERKTVRILFYFRFNIFACFTN